MDEFNNEVFEGATRKSFRVLQSAILKHVNAKASARNRISHQAMGVRDSPFRVAIGGVSTGLKCFDACQAYYNVS